MFNLGIWMTKPDVLVSLIIIYFICRMGYNGQECILRALCESPKVFGKRGKHLVAELIRTIFTFPKSKVLLFEHPQLKIYDKAYRRGKRDTAEECHNAYPKCGFSLIKLALGKYSMSTLKSFM
jgi:hypothetical protein